jgi:hypothetical protein
MSNQLHASLLRLPLLQILRTTGYHGTSPAVLDALTSLTSSYMTLLAGTVARICAQHNTTVPTVTHVRLALEELGMLPPSRPGTDDTRGVDTFIAWCSGETAKGNRRMAGTAHETEMEKLYEAELPPGEKLDFLNLLKMRGRKGAEDKFAGTALGDGLEHPVKIEGGRGLASIAAWEEMVRGRETSKDSTMELS